MLTTAYPQVANAVNLEEQPKTYCWRTVPGVWGFEAHADGCIRHSEKWTITGILHPVEGFIVPVSFEDEKVYVPARYLVAAAYLDKPGQVLMESRSGLAWRYDVARRNGVVTDDSAPNLYWRELPEPLDLDYLMRQRPVPRERRVMGGAKDRPNSEK